MTTLTDMLSRAGCVAAEEEAAELIAAAGGDRFRLTALAHRRVQGEPLAWVTGQATFGDLTIAIAPGIYVPRWQTEPLAEREDGPLIPSMAAEAIIRRCLVDKLPQPGARAAATDLELADYEALFEHRRISTGFRQGGAASDPVPLYRRLLGEAWGWLPPPLQVMHGVQAA